MVLSTRDPGQGLAFAMVCPSFLLPAWGGLSGCIWEASKYKGSVKVSKRGSSPLSPFKEPSLRGTWLNFRKVAPYSSQHSASPFETYEGVWGPD